MFRRLILEDWHALFTILAFVVAASVYVCTTYRALRMRRVQVDRLAHLPFNDQPEVHRHDTDSR